MTTKTATRKPVQKTPAKMGRPGLYTDALAEQICRMISEGKSLTEVCELEHMPARFTLYRWMREHADFNDAYTRAREERADLLAEEVLTIADETTDANLGRLRVDARKWAAAKLNPKTYGDKLQVDGDMRVKLTDDQLESRLSQLIGKAGTAVLTGREGTPEEPA